MGWRSADRDFFALLRTNGITRQGFNLSVAIELFFQFYEDLQYDDCAGDQLNIGWQPALGAFNLETRVVPPPPHAEVLVVGIERVLTEPEVRGRVARNPQRPVTPLNIGVVLHLPMVPGLSEFGRDELWCHRRADFAEFSRRIRAHPLRAAAGTMVPAAVIQSVGSDIRALVGPPP